MSYEIRIRHRLTDGLYKTIQKILDEECHIGAQVSYRICEEAIMHYRRDMERLYAVHHKLVHPTKHCSYLAFWIRKLKPISKAYPLSTLNSISIDVDPSIDQEVTNINEKISIYASLRYLSLYIKQGDIKFPIEKSSEYYLNRYEETLIDYFNSNSDAEMSMGNRFESLIYDMRFRTYGPHHLTHVLTHILREVARP